MVKVCDAIMGTGKSSAAITYMSEHPDKRFIYVTPYLAEATRIASSCDNISLCEPQKLAKFKGSKIQHTIDLVRRGESVATTHQAFRYYPAELLELVREQKYTLIIDENVEMLEEVDENPFDVQMAIDAGYIEKRENGLYHLVDDAYQGTKLRDLFYTLKTQDLIGLSWEKRESFFYWQLPIELITSFEDVFILTYLFNGQSLHHALEMNKIPYSFIGVDRDDDGTFRFSETGSYVPDYVKHIGDMIHIVDHQKLNAIGDNQFALSMQWFKKPRSDVKQLKNNLYNYFKNICHSPSDRNIWSTYDGEMLSLQGKGYTKGFTSFNQRATNLFRERDTAAYCVNLFMNVGRKLFYQSNGVAVSDDDYALSTMVQWVWRSAIRDGKEITLYVPSKRMRELFIDWIEEVSGS